MPAARTTTNCWKAECELFESKSAFLHSKSIVVDGVWSSVGSTNFDWRSFVHNNEISVCVIDQGFAMAMMRQFENDLAESKEITQAAWKKRGLRERFKEWMWLPSVLAVKEVGRTVRIPGTRPHLPSNRNPTPLPGHALLTPVAVGIAREHTLDAVPGGTDRLLGICPRQFGLALGDVPAGLEARLDDPRSARCGFSSYDLYA